MINRVGRLQKAGPAWALWTWARRARPRPTGHPVVRAEAKVIKAETFVTHVVERVKAPSLAAAEAVRRCRSRTWPSSAPTRSW